MKNIEALNSMNYEDDKNFPQNILYASIYLWYLPLQTELVYER